MFLYGFKAFVCVRHQHQIKKGAPNVASRAVWSIRVKLGLERGFATYDLA